MFSCYGLLRGSVLLVYKQITFLFIGQDGGELIACLFLVYSPSFLVGGFVKGEEEKKKKRKQFSVFLH